jgi:putative ABC transport system substrate-binding protein
VKRREFITLLGGAAVAWPLAARAQQPRKLPTIGFLSAGGPVQNVQWIAAFTQRLHELGWVETHTVAIEYRWGEARMERVAAFATELVRLKVDVIVTQATQPPILAKQATTTIPIVFVATGDPVGSGLVASLARPGGNATGLSLQNTESTGKRLEILRGAVPGLSRLAVLFDVGNPSNTPIISELKVAALTLGLELVILEYRRADEIASAFESLEGRVEAIYVLGGPLAVTNRAQIHTLAMGARLPAIYNSREYVEAGGLMSYGPNLQDLYRRAGDFVDKILRGTKPADIPVEQPTKFDLVINLTTAKALGLTVPSKLLALANEVIE